MPARAKKVVKAKKGDKKAKNVDGNATRRKAAKEAKPVKSVPESDLDTEVPEDEVDDTTMTFDDLEEGEDSTPEPDEDGQ